MKHIIIGMIDSHDGYISNIVELSLKWKLSDEAIEDIKMNSLDIKQEMCAVLRRNLIEAISDPKLDLSELIK